MSKILVILSGGIDSTVLLHQHINSGDSVRALSIDYGQRHRRELSYAEKTCRRLSVPWELADLRSLRALLPGSALTDSSVKVPEGHYSEDSMKATVVPNRNMIMLSVAVGHAIAYKCEAVSYAAHSGDHAIYPDCRTEFITALNSAVVLCDWSPIQIVGPFSQLTKAGIVELGCRLGVDFSQTYSCYKGERKHCGKCGTCVERREAFYLAQRTDPTVYQSDAPSIETLVLNQWKL